MSDRPAGFWHELTGEERLALRAAARPRTFTPGTQLVREGDEADHVMVIEHGWAKITSNTESGHEVLLAVRAPGDLVGEGAVLSQRLRSATVTALAPLQALVMPGRRFTVFLDEHPRAWQLVSTSVMRRLEAADRRVQAHATSNGAQRLALLLIELAETYGEPAPDGSIELRPPLTQGELAGWVDVSRETVARTLKIWRDSELIKTGWRRITILDLPGLHAYTQERQRQS